MQNVSARPSREFRRIADSVMSVEAALYGVAAGSAALLTPGTRLCRRDDVMRLHGQVVSNPL